MNGHTQGRVKVQHPHAGERGYEVAFEPGLEQLCQNITEANARRLAACWNACEGIATPDLEVDNVTFTEMLRERTTLKAQRDELLAALRVVQSQCESMADADWRTWVELASPEEFERWVKSRAAHMAVQANAAIAKATNQAGTGPATGS